jgi:phage regulator Rha-like protein
MAKHRVPAQHMGIRGNLPTTPDLELIVTTTGPRADSRELAKRLGTQHQNLYELVKDHQADFEEFGKVRFETGASPGSTTGQMVKFAMLNEDQSLLALTYSRNTAKVRALKVKLVKAFGHARRALEVRQTEYLPAYHLLHDTIKELANGSPNERFMHMNANKALNQFAGLDVGQRVGAPLPTQSLMVVGQMLMASAMKQAKSPTAGLQKAKQTLLAISTATMMGVSL